MHNDCLCVKHTKFLASHTRWHMHHSPNNYKARVVLFELSTVLLLEGGSWRVWGGLIYGPEWYILGGYIIIIMTYSLQVP